MARVARGYGQDFGTTLDAPFADVLVADMALDELDRIDALQHASERLALAQLIAVGTQQPKELAAEGRRLDAAIRRIPKPVEERDRERDVAVERIERAMRVNRRKRRQRG